MRIVKLKRLPFEKVVEAFNHAFCDYVLPMQYTEKQLRERWKRANVDYSLSYGISRYGKLVAFMAHGTESRENILTAFNAGTGVVPSARGLHLVTHMYRRALQEFSRQGIGQVTLEVIKTNRHAISSYFRSGFRIGRELLCFRGTISVATSQINASNLNFQIRSEAVLPHFDETDFFNFQPSWENSRGAIERSVHSVNVLSVRTPDGDLAGIAVFSPARRQLLQFGIRRQNRSMGLGTKLFQRLQSECPEIVVNNIDSRDSATCLFLERLGLINYVEQYEMTLEVSSVKSTRPSATTSKERVEMMRSE